MSNFDSAAVFPFAGAVFFPFRCIANEAARKIPSYTLMRCKYAELVAAIYASSPLIKSRQIADRSKLKDIIMKMEISGDMNIPPAISSSCAFSFALIGAYE